VHPWSSLLTQAVGLEPPAEPSVVAGQIDPEDVFLVCSDGLVTHLTDERVAEILERHLPEGLGSTAQALVDAANAEGGIDNITVGLLRVASPPG
jgi:protein phosphatase